MQIDVHIGIEKTGSTAIQSWLQHNRDVLAQAGILYPRSLGERFSANLAAACQRNRRPDDLRKVRGLLTQEAVDEYREALHEKLAAEIRRSKPSRLVLSCEHFFGRLWREEELTLLRDFLTPFATNIRIWLYLRRQDEWFLSAYSTAVSSGRVAPFHYPALGNERPMLHYDQLLQRWSAAFGREAVHAALYSSACDHPQGVVGHFCQWLELPEAPSPRSDRANPSLGEAQLEFLRQFNTAVPPFDEAHQPNLERGDIIGALSLYNGSGGRLAVTGEEGWFLERFAEGNEWVAQQWFEGASARELFGEPPAAVEPGADSDSAEEAAALAIHLWRFQQLRQRRAIAREQAALARLDIARGDSDSAAARLQGLAEDVARQPSVLLARAECLLAAGDAQQALASLREGLSLAEEGAEHGRAATLGGEPPVGSQIVQELRALEQRVHEVGNTPGGLKKLARSLRPKRRS